MVRIGKHPFCLMVLLLLSLVLFVASSRAQEIQPPAAGTGDLRFLLLISEQNIEGPQHVWWASEIDLSVVESVIAQYLIAQGHTVLEPLELHDVISQEDAFRYVDMKLATSIELAKLAQADYIILGKAVASSGATVLSSNLRSCFANITAKLIHVKSGKIIAYLSAEGRSVHLDAISGGREALNEAATKVAMRAINTFTKEEGQ